MFNVEELATLHKAKVILLRKARTNARAFNDPGAVKQYLSIAHATNEPQRESFRILFLDNQHRLIADEVAFYGTIDASPVYPRVVVQKALEHNAAAIMLSHNHPSGIAEPSTADRNITNRLKDALALIDVRILDHFVIGDDNVVSFAERGWL